jgi:hypothetical protein
MVRLAPTAAANHSPPESARAGFMSVGLQGSCILFCILTPNYDRLAHRRLFSLTRLLFNYTALLGYFSAI